MAKGKQDIKREFDAFASKIARLESLKQELNVLDTKGFESEVKLIRARLKDVNAIPDIERDIGVLREKIKNRYERHSADGKLDKKVQIESDNLKRDTKSLRNKINSLEDEIKKRKALSGKPKLSKEDRASIDDIPKIEGKLSGLKKEFDTHTHASTMKIDSGVGIIVDNKFGDFLSEIKSQLSVRLKEKEMFMDDKLKMDLEEHETEFSQKYKDLVDELHEKYKEKVNYELKKEVHARFDEELEKRLKEEERKLVAQLVNENAKRLVADRKKLVHNLHQDYNNKSNLLAKKIANERMVQSKKIEAERKKMKEKINAVDKRRKLINQDEISARKKLNEERVNLEKQFAELKKDEEHSLVKAKNIDKKEYSAKLSALRLEMNKKLHQRQLANDLQRKNKIAKEIEFLKKKMEEHANDFINSEKKKLEARINAVKNQEMLLASKNENVKKILAKEKEKLSESFERMKKDSRNEIENIKKEVEKKKKELEKVKNVDKDKLRAKIDALNAVKERNHIELQNELAFLHREREGLENKFINKLAKIKESRERYNSKMKEDKIKFMSKLNEDKNRNNSKMKEDMERTILEEKNKLMREEQEKLNEDKNRVKSALSAESKNKIGVARAEMNKRLREEHKRVATELSKMKNQEKVLSAKSANKQMQIVKEKEKLSNSFHKLYEQQKKAMEQTRKVEEQRLEQHKRENDAKFGEKVEEIRMKMKQDLEEQVKKKTSEAERNAEKQIKQKEHLIRKQLEREYNAKMQLELRKKETDMANRKAELERHVLEQAKKLFN